MQNYQSLKVWSKAVEIVKQVYKVSELLPKTEQFGITLQIKRYSVSIVSNIAEGASRRSTTDFRRFLEIALGSAFELKAQIIICEELSFLKAEADELLLRIGEEKRMIHSFMGKLKT